MKELSRFNIDIFRLGNGEHAYQFEINDSFFDHFGYGLLEKGQATVDVLLDKRETFISLDFTIKGSVELTCDRSLEKFDFPLDSSDKIILKFGEEEKEINEEITIILKNTQRINIAQYIYEFITIAVPYKKVHPRYAEEDSPEDEWSEGTIVYTDNTEQEDTGDTPDEGIDPRWNALNGLKDKLKDRNQ